jgi:uncharacterized protein YbjT (DUF2867 family)/tryptophan-rich sensory protein
MTQPSPARSRVLLTGATGYVGGRLLRRLEARGYRVRCLARRPEHLGGRIGPETEVVAGDVLDRPTLDAALAGVQVVYYLVHSMGSAGAFEEEDRSAARNVGEAARAAGVRRIVYLGGLGDSSQPLSPHLRSRQEVGEVLRASGVEVIELRASIVIGSGSLSFEMIRALVDRLPVMVAPRWVSVPAQPIAIQNLIEYLQQALELPPDGNRIIEIGGADQASYGDLMREYARQRGLRRVILPVPVLTPWLSGLWLGLVTPLFARVGRKLIDSIRYPTVVRDEAARTLFEVQPLGYREAIAAALRNEDSALAETRWSDALSSSGPVSSESEARLGPRLVDVRVIQVHAPPDTVFATVRRIGGRVGWYYGDWLWQLRGALDLLVGGVGMRRGRRDPEQLRVGDTVDFWRVEACEPDRRLRLAAEMRLPGRAWLEFEVEGDGERGTVLRQTALFDPLGLVGLAYWYLVYPLHRLVFRGMLRGIVRAATQSAAPPERPRLAQGLALLVSIAVCFGAAAIGSLLTMEAVGTWYPTLAKPTWTPPSSVFGPVWSVLYLLMAIAAWLVWRRSLGRPTARPLILFAVQLVLNVLWSGLFFGLRLPGAAFFEIVLLWVAIVATAAAFRGVSPLASWLLVPYLAWSSFAAALNYAIWRLNA